MNIQDINILLLILFIWCIPWYLYNCLIRSKTYHPLSKIFINLPQWITCTIPYVHKDPIKNKDACKLVHFDGWCIGHILIYLTIGLFFTGKYTEVFIISILCEIYEYIVGWRAKWILDPLVNMIGYVLGDLINKIFHLNLYYKISHIAFFKELNCTYLLILLIGIILYLNRPCMISTFDE